MFVCFPVGTFAAEHCDSQATAYQPRIIRCDFKRRAIPKLDNLVRAPYNFLDEQRGA